MSKRRKSFRVGQKVRLTSDPSKVFTIVKSIVPPRIFRLRGMKGFYLKNELQAISAPENLNTSLRLSGLGESCAPSAHCAQGVSSAPKIEPRECLECQTPFTPKKPWGQFCREQCRRAWWARSRRKPQPDSASDSQPTLGV